MGTADPLGEGGAAGHYLLESPFLNFQLLPRVRFFTVGHLLGDNTDTKQKLPDSGVGEPAFGGRKVSYCSSGYQLILYSDKCYGNKDMADNPKCHETAQKLRIKKNHLKSFKAVQNNFFLDVCSSQMGISCWLVGKENHIVYLRQSWF